MQPSETAWQIQHCHNVQCVHHLHMEAEFVLVTEGTLHVLKSGSETVLRAGEALYLMPLEIHGFYTESISRCTILIFPTDLVPDFAVMHSQSHPLVLPAALGETLTALDPNDHYDRLHVRAVLYPLCCEISDACSDSGAAHTDLPSIGRVERYIWDHLATPLSLSSVATATGFNPSYLSRMFRQNKGVGFLEYINMLRCYQAVRLMSSSQPMSLSEIAYQVGFESIRTFNRVFRARYGITPSQMKNQRTASIPKI